MSRSDKIIGLSEAIKLGSLGVSTSARMTPALSHTQSTPKSPSDNASNPDLDPDLNDLSLHGSNPQKMNDKVTRIQWIDGEPGRMGWVYGLKWSESNRFKFYMNCRLTSTGNYKIYMAGGRDLSVTFSTSFSGRAQNADFRGELDFTATDDAAAKQKLEHIVSEIKKAGSFAYAIASGSIGHGWIMKALLSQRLEIYLWNSCRVRTTSNMKIIKSVV